MSDRPATVPPSPSSPSNLRASPSKRSSCAECAQPVLSLKLPHAAAVQLPHAPHAPHELPHAPHAVSKHDFFLRHRNSAQEAFEGVGAFQGENALLRDLRIIFDWMAQAPRAERIPSRKFKQRLPEIHRKFPQLATSFARMDANQDCWLDWQEFVNFCLRDERLRKMMKRSTLLTVHGRDLEGVATFKDDLDPAYVCESGPPPPLLPWESAHVVAWRIDGLRLSSCGSPVTYRGMRMRPGASIASRPFRAAGVCGFLRFWPVSYWNETQRRKKAALPPGTEELAALGPSTLPSAASWCCLGVCLPAGSHLQLRLFVHEERSAPRECYWDTGVTAGQLWAPPQSEAPPDLVSRVAAGESLVVGLEVLKNFNAPPGRARPELLETAERQARRPALSDPELQGAAKSVLLGRAARPHGVLGLGLDRAIGRAASLPRLARSLGEDPVLPGLGPGLGLGLGVAGKPSAGDLHGSASLHRSGSLGDLTGTPFGNRTLEQARLDWALQNSTVHAL